MAHLKQDSTRSTVSTAYKWRLACTQLSPHTVGVVQLLAVEACLCTGGADVH